MRFVADEGVDRAIVERLRQDGHSVTYVAEITPGISDDNVLKAATEQGSPLITTDKDFGELIFRQRRLDAGVILVRLAGMTQEGKVEAVAAAVKLHGDQMRNAFSVISAGMVRIRPQDANPA